MNDKAKHKYASIGFIYLFGAICASFLISGVCFAVSAFFGTVFAVFLKTKKKLSIYAAILFCAFFIYALCDVAFIEKAYSLAGKTCNVSGIITEVKIPDNDTVLLEISGKAENVPVRFVLFTEDTGAKTGDKITLKAKFTSFRDNAEFSERTYYYSKGVFLKAAAADEIVITKGFSGINGGISRLSHHFISAVEKYLSGDEAGIVKAMIFGDKSSLSDKLSADIKRAGVAHMTAVSGMHLSVMCHIAAAFLGALLKSKRLFIAALSAFTILLMLFFGMTVSVLRSGIMLLIYYGSSLIYRKTSPLNSVSTALFIILAVSPWACRDMGLWLSVLGTIGVGTVAPLVCKRLKINRADTLKTAVVSSLCASACTLPAGMLCFGGFSLASVVTGLIIQPLFVIILASVPVAAVLPFLARPLLAISGFTAKIMNKIISAIGGLSFSYIETDEKSAVFILFAFAVTTLACIYFFGKRSAAKFSVLYVCVLLISVCGGNLIGRDDIKINVLSDGSSGIIIVDDKTGVSAFTLSDKGKTVRLIERHISGQRLNFICSPADGKAKYDINGKYTAYVSEGSVVLNIRGVEIGLVPLSGGGEFDIAVGCGYRKNNDIIGNFATILCDKRFYNCEDNFSAYYDKTSIVINSRGEISIKGKD